MGAYNAIMKAADHIESNPKSFEFCSINMPTLCGTPGCALGWVGFFAGNRRPDMCDVAEKVLGLSIEDGDQEFYDRMDGLVNRWRTNPMRCAKGLRLYAEKYHAPPLPYVDLPAIVREIFNERVMS